LTFSDGSAGQFRSFCYTDPEDRAFVKGVTEAAARHFDEIILDDFFFVTTKQASDIAAKGTRSWSQFRVDLMNEAAENLVLKPARAVNPRVKVVIKYPNWYEHFQALGFDLDQGPRLFDGIYTGTETRDPVATDQFLQQYESYQIYRYFENIAPGRNGGGWIGHVLRVVSRSLRRAALGHDVRQGAGDDALQLGGADRACPIRASVPSGRSSPRASTTSACRSITQTRSQARRPQRRWRAWPAIAWNRSMPSWASWAGRSAIASYKPHHSTGEEFLHNYVGMLGIPIDLRPTFPTDADLMLLTESAAFDS